MAPSPASIRPLFIVGLALLGATVVGAIDLVLPGQPIPFATLLLFPGAVALVSTRRHTAILGGYVAVLAYPIVVDDPISVIRAHIRYVIFVLVLGVCWVVADRRSHAEERAQRVEELRERERAVLDSTPFVMVAFGRDGRVDSAGGQELPLLGHRPEALVGGPVDEIFHGDVGTAAGVRRCLAGEPVDSVLSVRDRQWMARLRPLRDGRGAVSGGLVVAFDVTEGERVVEALQASEERYRSIVESTSEGVLVVDEVGVMTFVNEQGAEMLGSSPTAMIGRSALPVDGDPTASSLMPAHLSEYRAGQPLQYEQMIRRADGTRSWFLVCGNPLSDTEGRFTGALAMFTDITERKRQEADLEQLALRDALTGLANRQLLRDRMEHVLSRRSHPGFVAVLFCDLDQFKAVNDSLGHPAGDELLRQVALRLRKAVRPEDTLARLGGDEFVVLCEDVPSTAAAVEVAERLLTACNVPSRIDGTELHVTLSIGIALARPTEASDARLLVDALLRDADTALYRAKERGRARAELFDESMAVAARRKLQTLSDLRCAVERAELVLHYQPVIDLTDGGTVAAEALLRWRHPVRGLLNPGEFLPVAEESGVLVDLGRWALREALRQGSAWPSQVQMAVNLSVRELLHPDLLATVEQALADTAFPAQRLVLELTESGLMSELATGAATLTALRDLGVKIALDDFGTGYSSFSYLARLPLDELKLDRSFVADLATPRGRAVVSGVIGLAHALSLPLVAEGVETPEQAAQLVSLGCDLAQGFHLGRPMAWDAFSVRLEALT